MWIREGLTGGPVLRAVGKGGPLAVLRAVGKGGPLAVLRKGGPLS